MKLYQGNLFQLIYNCVDFFCQLLILFNILNSDDNDATDKQRQFIVDHLYSLLKDSRINRQESWLRLVLDLFLIYGFYTTNDSFVDANPRNNKV
jgi:hypothetical protein